MLTKEELLQKGISDEIADEIVAGYPSEDSQDEVSPLEDLQKALDPEMDNLSKAAKGEKEEDSEDEEKGDYNENFMKKMKRYMKEKGKMFKEEKEEMKKAVDELDLDSEGAVIEMADLAPILERQAEFNEIMSKAIENIAANMVIVSEKSDKSFDLMQKAAKVTAVYAGGMDKFLATPEGRKGVVADAKMNKAKETAVEQNRIVYEVLQKATLSGDREAGYIASVFESSGKNLKVLNDKQRAYINTLIKKEAN